MSELHTTETRDPRNLAKYEMSTALMEADS